MDIGYFNARIRGLRAALLTSGELDAFLKTESVEQFAEGLKATAYARRLAGASLNREGAQDVVEEALLRNASDTLGFISKTAPVKVRPLVKALFAPLEAYNLKAVIRGLARAVKREDMPKALMPAGDFDSAALAALIGAKDVYEAAGMLSSWASPYAPLVAEALKQKPLRLFELELRLDKFAFEYALSLARGRSCDAVTVRKVTAWRIDTENIMTLFKVSAEGYSGAGAEEYFITGGERVGKEIFAGLFASKDAVAVLDGLGKAVKDKEWAGVLANAFPEEPELLEIALERALETRLWKAAVTAPLSIALAASYVLRKAREVKSLRIALSAKVSGMPPEAAKRYMGG